MTEPRIVLDNGFGSPCAYQFLPLPVYGRKLLPCTFHIQLLDPRNRDGHSLVSSELDIRRDSHSARPGGRTPRRLALLLLTRPERAGGKAEPAKWRGKSIRQVTLLDGTSSPSFTY